MPTVICLSDSNQTFGFKCSAVQIQIQKFGFECATVATEFR